MLGMWHGGRRGKRRGDAKDQLWTSVMAGRIQGTRSGSSTEPPGNPDKDRFRASLSLYVSRSDLSFLSLSILSRDPMGWVAVEGSDTCMAVEG